MSIKAERVSSEMIKELTDIIYSESDDKRFKTVTITDIETSDDLGFAKVFFTSPDEDRNSLVKELNEAVPFFKKFLSERLEVRQIPDLRFIYDESIEYAENIEKIIDEIHNK